MNTAIGKFEVIELQPKNPSQVIRAFTVTIDGKSSGVVMLTNKDKPGEIALEMQELSTITTAKAINDYADAIKFLSVYVECVNDGSIIDESIIA